MVFMQVDCNFDVAFHQHLVVAIGVVEKRRAGLVGWIEDTEKFPVHTSYDASSACPQTFIR